jgi:hypothetical protein
MPCDCSHLEPTRRERELKRAAQLIVYVEGFQKGVTPAWIKEQAEATYGTDERLVPYLCKILNEMAPGQRERIIYNGHNKIARDLADWWEEHQRVDRERIKREQAEAEKTRTRKQALLKLSSAEKKALGIKE